MRPVLVGCPVRERAWILPDYLARLSALETWETLGSLDRRSPVRFHFVVQPSADRTEEIIADWCAGRPNASWGRVTGAPAGWRRDAGASRYSIPWLAAIRNVLAERALAAGCDLLSVDSDVLAPSHVLRVLSSRARPVCAALLSNTPGLPAGDPGAAPNGETVDGDRLGAVLGPVRVRWTGACCLYAREVLASGVRWGPHARGEDVEFCRRAWSAGWSCWLDTSLRAEHVMQEPGTDQGR